MSTVEQLAAVVQRRDNAHDALLCALVELDITAALMDDLLERLHEEHAAEQPGRMI